MSCPCIHHVTIVQWSCPQIDCYGFKRNTIEHLITCPAFQLSMQLTSNSKVTNFNSYKTLSNYKVIDKYM